jgi:hypothetical protein
MIFIYKMKSITWKIHLNFHLTFLSPLYSLIRGETNIQLHHTRIIRQEIKKKKTPWSESASELYRPSDRCLLAKLMPTFVDRGCHVVSMTDPYGRIIAFLDRSRYVLFQAAPQLYSQGWVDPVPDTLHLRKSGSARNRTRTSGSIARNSDH